MKAKRHRNRTLPNPLVRSIGYDPSIKRAVILLAEKHGHSEARKRFGICDDTIKRWLKNKTEIMELAEQSIRRSSRRSTGQGSESEASASQKKYAKLDKCLEVKIEKTNVGPHERLLDAMPLRQRLTHGQEAAPQSQSQEPVLQSLPISPTKLKVTRQGKPAPSPQPNLPPAHVCLKWNSHHTNMQTSFPSLLNNEQYVDVTLVSEGKPLKCHRMILSSCSPYFDEVLNGIGPFQHPVIFMKDVSFWTLKALCDFMYAGEVHILQERLPELLRVATSLKIKGLANSQETTEDIKPQVTPIKQELDPTNPSSPEKPLDQPKQEKVEESPPLKPTPPKAIAPKATPPKAAPVKPTPPKPAPPKPAPPKPTSSRPVPPKSSSLSRPSSSGVGRPRKKEKLVIAQFSEKEKEKEKVVFEEPIKATPKPVAKVVSKAVLPKAPPVQKTTTVRNPVKASLNSRPTSTRLRHPTRRIELRRTERLKSSLPVPKEIEKEKEKEKELSPLKKGNINDPLDLLQPVYEEVAKTDTPAVCKIISTGKLKERGNIPVKKTVNKKVRKRRYVDYHEEREESPPLVFSSRKGTRSRPNVKIPKFFHTTCDEPAKETSDATIVREPHTNQNDPLEEAEVEEIKAEPFDMDDSAMEMDDSCVDYMEQDQEMSSQDEEILANYDSPLVNIKREVKQETPNIFKKELSPKPMIVNVHSVEETDPRLLNIKKEDVLIVDIGQISTGATLSQDAVETRPKSPSNIIITHVQSMAEVPDEPRLREPDKGDDISKTVDTDPLQATTEADPLAEDGALNIKIAEVRSGVFDNSCEDVSEVGNNEESSVQNISTDHTCVNTEDEVVEDTARKEIVEVETDSIEGVETKPVSEKGVELEAPVPEEDETVEEKLSTMDTIATVRELEQELPTANDEGDGEEEAERAVKLDKELHTVDDANVEDRLTAMDTISPADDAGAEVEEQTFELARQLHSEDDGITLMDTVPPVLETRAELEKQLSAEDDAGADETVPPLPEETFELGKDDGQLEDRFTAMVPEERAELEKELSTVYDGEADETIPPLPEETSKLETDDGKLEDRSTATVPEEHSKLEKQLSTVYDGEADEAVPPPPEESFELEKDDANGEDILMSVEAAPPELEKELSSMDDEIPAERETTMEAVPPLPDETFELEKEIETLDDNKDEATTETVALEKNVNSPDDAAATETVALEKDLNLPVDAATAETVPHPPDETYKLDKELNPPHDNNDEAITKTVPLVPPPNAVDKDDAAPIIEAVPSLQEESADLGNELHTVDDKPDVEGGKDVTPEQNTDCPNAELMQESSFIRDEHAETEITEDASVEDREYEDLNTPEEENYDTIEDELERCLASTSTQAKGDVRFRVKSLPMDDDEDFTKDIELDALPVTNRPTNYLGDDYEDFEMDDIAQSPYRSQVEDVQMDDVQSTMDERQIEGDKPSEETLLSELDDDVIMKDATTSQGGSERVDEKTLEMIVNDLNASLGDMTK